jgi:hypothetical protein
VGDDLSILQLVSRFEEALTKRSWARIRGLFLDDARIESVAAGIQALGPDETVVAMRSAAEGGIYTLGPWTTETLGPDVAIVYSRMRHHVAKGAITDEGLYWLMTRRGDLFWRVRIFRDRAAAVACLAERGPSLGL